ncbi:MAG: phage holin family protein [Chloroflexi bacterium]|nr:phage holin family protein [Chloroflexota bacterium]
MRFLIRLLINAAALWAATRLIPGIAYEGGWPGLVLVALVFGVLNAVIRPILGLLTCPLQILTLGLFTLVLNAVMLLLTSSISGALGLQFSVAGFAPAFWGALVVSIVSFLLTLFVKDEKRR